ncbi:hypothetical protein N9B12_00760 [bacterium]|nr:hypothetical protein [bacterium]|tara:strand:- start:92 stop:403 length:312 start_codon:yes stop_codon:yes gene_type:complete
MGNSHLSTLIYIGVIPALLTGVALSYIGGRFELNGVQTALIAVPLWLFVLCGWVFGMAAIGTTFASVYELFHPFPRCKACDKKLATRLARQCIHCGADWHGLD